MQTFARWTNWRCRLKNKLKREVVNATDTGNKSVIVAAEENKDSFKINICYFFQYCKILNKITENILFNFFYYIEYRYLPSARPSKEQSP